MLRTIYGFRRHVPGRREVGQRVHRREQSGDEFRRQKTGIASTHADVMVSAAARPNSAWY